MIHPRTQHKSDTEINKTSVEIELITVRTNFRLKKKSSLL